MSLDSELDDLHDDTLLWRRLPPEKCVFDQNLNRYRPTSNAFTDNQKDGSPMTSWEMNVVQDPQTIIEGFEGWYVVAFSVATAKQAGLQVVRTPEHGKGHCDVVGKKTQSVQNRLAKNCQWVIGPSEVLVE